MVETKMLILMLQTVESRILCDVTVVTSIFLYTVYAANQLTETLYLVHVSVLATKLLLFQLFIKHCTLTYSTVQKF